MRKQIVVEVELKGGALTLRNVAFESVSAPEKFTIGHLEKHIARKWAGHDWTTGKGTPGFGFLDWETSNAPGYHLEGDIYKISEETWEKIRKYNYYFSLDELK